MKGYLFAAYLITTALAVMLPSALFLNGSSFYGAFAFSGLLFVQFQVGMARTRIASLEVQLAHKSAALAARAEKELR